MYCGKQGSYRRRKNFLVSGRETLGRLRSVIDISRLQCLLERGANSFTHHIPTMHILCAWHSAVLCSGRSRVSRKPRPCPPRPDHLVGETDVSYVNKNHTDKGNMANVMSVSTEAHSAVRGI